MNLLVGERGQQDGFWLSHSVSVTRVFKGCHEWIYLRRMYPKHFCLTENDKSNG